MEFELSGKREHLAALVEYINKCPNVIYPNLNGAINQPVNQLNVLCNRKK